jgi:hypothetical protein
MEEQLPAVPAAGPGTPSSQHARGTPPAASAPATDEAGLTGRLDAELGEAQRNTALSEAPAPELTPRGDGGYRFHGNGIDATIDPDGRVHFEDKYAKGMTFDLNAWAEHLAGNDPYRSERRWFLERTAGLRDELANSRLKRLAKLTGPDLERALAQIWADPRLPPAIRRQRTLELWDATAWSPQAANARAQILVFVQARCPLGSACAFHAEELREFNARRAPSDQFSPYGASPDPASRQTP